MQLARGFAHARWNREAHEQEKRTFFAKAGHYGPEELVERNPSYTKFTVKK